MSLPSVRPNVARMHGYVPGEQFNDPEFIKLNTNENPYPPSPRVFEALRQHLEGDILRKYPEPLGDRFRQAASSVLNIDPDSILIGNGSDDILTILTRAFVPETGLIVSPTPSYLLYSTLAELQNARFQAVPFTDDWRLPTNWPFPDADLTFLANPNSPSGTIITLPDIRKLASALKKPLIFDEAYVDFADTSAIELVGTVPNVIVTRSLSKYYALAGIRFGFACADPAIIAQLNKVKDSYNCDALSLAAATAAILDQEYYADLRSKILATRGRMIVGLTELGFQITPPHANFVWCRHPTSSMKAIYEELKRRKILIRYMTYPGYGDGLRITVGTVQEIDRLLKLLSEIV